MKQVKGAFPTTGGVQPSGSDDAGDDEVNGKGSDNGNVGDDDKLTNYDDDDDGNDDDA